MNEINNLGCDEYPAQAEKPCTASETASGAPGVENLAAFARRLGVNRSTVTRAAQSGRLVLAADGRVVIAASLARWHATRGGRDDVAARHAAARGHELPGVAAVATPATQPATTQIGPLAGDQATAEAQGADADSRARWEADKLAWQNRLLLVSLDLQSGARIPRPALQREAHGLGATLRATVERLIDQTAPRLAAAASDADRRRLLAAEIGAARRLLRREFGAALRRLRPEQLGAVGLRLDATPEATQETAA